MKCEHQSGNSGLCSWPGYEARTHTYMAHSKGPGVPEENSCTHIDGNGGSCSRSWPWKKGISHRGGGRTHPCSICTEYNSGPSTGTVCATTWAVNSISDLLQHKSVHTDTIINCIRESLDIFKEFSISGFENHCNNAKQFPQAWK